jgi:hypothetical protein
VTAGSLLRVFSQRERFVIATSTQVSDVSNVGSKT